MNIKYTLDRILSLFDYGTYTIFSDHGCSEAKLAAGLDGHQELFERVSWDCVDLIK